MKKERRIRKIPKTAGGNLALMAYRWKRYLRRK